eukprot:NODE_358_length_10198_cov_0.265076.p5 type:complete len:258 gc:universal NODE_358_length_10198_cov_0.265076:2478-1705(-)
MSSTLEALTMLPTESEIALDELLTSNDYELNISRVAYFAFGLNLAFIFHAFFNAFRVFKVKNLPFKLTIWGLSAGFFSTMLSYSAAYWSDEESSKILTTMDGTMYVQMVLATFILYTRRLKSLSPFPEANNYMRWIPYVIGLILIPDDVFYVTSAWIESESIYKGTKLMAAISGLAFLLFSLAIYSVLAKKMFGFLTVEKKKLGARLFAIIIGLVLLDIFVVCVNFINADLYNSIYSLSFIIKILACISFYDEDEWM